MKPFVNLLGKAIGIVGILFFAVAMLISANVLMQTLSFVTTAGAVVLFLVGTAALFGTLSLAGKRKFWIGGIGRNDEDE